MKKLLCSIVCGFLVLMLCLSCTRKAEEEVSPIEGAAMSDEAAAPAGKVVELSYRIFFPPAHAHASPEKTGHRDREADIGAGEDQHVSCRDPHSAGECYDGVVKGISDIGMSCFAYTRGRFPGMEAVDLPMGYSSGMAATRAANEYYARIKPAELYDVHVLYIHAHGPGLLHTKRPVAKLEDLKGMKIRATGLSAKQVEVLGGVPVAMPQPGTFEALQRESWKAHSPPWKRSRDGSRAKSSTTHRLCLDRLYHRHVRGHEQGQVEQSPPRDSADLHGCERRVRRRTRQGLG